jgi:protein-S-isoprenylcysteine O-methyltransferase Ste14
MKMRLARLLAWWPTERMLRIAAVTGLAALALMTLGVFDPRPLQVVISMSVSQVFGVAAFLMYFLSIAADILQARARLQAQLVEARAAALGKDTSSGGTGAP